MSRAQPLRVADYLKHIVEAIGNIHEREPQTKLLINPNWVSSTPLWV